MNYCVRSRAWGWGMLACMAAAVGVRRVATGIRMTGFGTGNHTENGRRLAGSVRFHTGGGGKTGFEYAGFRDALAGIVRVEGWRGLFKGAGARVLFFMPSQAISIASFEYFKDLFHKYL